MGGYFAKEAYYSEVATSYDGTRFRSLKGRWIDAREKLSITKALRGIPLDSSILDIPCGTGRITSHLLSLGYRVTGADISCDMIELARQRIGEHPRLNGLRTLDAEQLDLEDNSFDGITSVRLMGHLPPNVKIRVLKEWARVASKFVVVTFYYAGPLRSLKWWLTTGRRMSKCGWWHPVSQDELDALFAECSLHPIGKWPVSPVVSDGITYLLSPPR